MNEETPAPKPQRSRAKRYLIGVSRLTLWTSCIPAPFAFAWGAQSSLAPIITLTMIYYVLAGMLDFHLSRAGRQKITSDCVPHTIFFFCIMVILVPVVLIGSCFAAIALKS